MIAPIGAPAVNIPDDSTQIACYLYDYTHISVIMNNLYSSLTTNPVYMNQKLRISAHMEYILRNQTNDRITIEVYRWTLKKMPSKEMCSIQYSSATAPIPTFNILNLMGKSMFEQNMGTAAPGNALSTNMGNAEISMSELALVNEYCHIKKFKITLLPGRMRSFKIGKRLLDLNTLDIYSEVSLALPPSSYVNWANAAIPGATGLLFRSFGTPCTINQLAGGQTDNSPVTYSRPQILMTTKTTYTVYDWIISGGETQGKYSLGDTGIVAGTNASAAFINDQSSGVVFGTAS